jgi:transcriptional regulator with XRE-family HTH domain
LPLFTQVRRTGVLGSPDAGSYIAPILQDQKRSSESPSDTDRLAELRKERGLTLREVRDLAHERTGERLSVSYLSELERTDDVPSVETLLRLCKAYGLTLNNFLTPVDFFDEARYPRELRDLTEEQRIPDQWAETLSRIEFRGRRPKSQDEWLAIYSVLKAFMEPEG